MRRLCAFAMILAIAIPTAAFAHGVVGDYVFLEPLIAEDPTPANEWDVVQPSWNKTSAGNNFSLGSSLEKVLYLDENYMARVSVGIGTEWHYQWVKNAPDQRGFDDLDVRQMGVLRLGEARVSALGGGAVAGPHGQPSVEEQSHTSLGPLFLWEKGMGYLPNWTAIKYLRPFGFQGDFSYLPALGGHTSHLMSADQVVEILAPISEQLGPGYRSEAAIS